MSFPKYPAYKDSGVEWIGEIPVGWEILTLKRAAKTPLSYGANASAENDNSDWPRFIRITDIDDAGLLREDTFRSLEPEEASEYLLDDGDILFARSGATVGKSFIYKDQYGPACYAGYLIRLKVNNNFLPKYIYYFSLSFACKEQILSGQIQSTIQNFSAEKYANLIAPLPPFLEQQVIVSFLDRECGKIDALIAEQERLIALLAEKRQAVISHAVTKGLNPNVPMKDSGIPWIGMVPEGWEVVKLKHIGRFFGGAGFPHEFQGNENLELGFYKVGDLSRSTDGVFMALAQHTVTCETAEQLKANVIPRNSILYAKIGAALLLNRRRISPDKCCIDNNMTAFVPNIPVHVKWSFWWLSFIDFSRFVKPGTVPSLSEGDQKEIAALLPPDRELDSIIEYIEANVNRINLLEREISRGISISKERRTALISAAVTGKIDVRAQSKAIAP